MRSVRKLIIHCSYTKPSMAHVDAEWIRRVHVDENGWSDIGYHKVVLRDGTVEQGRDDARSGAHCRGHNHDSIGICMVGGMSEDGQAECNFTLAQWRALDDVLNDYLAKYPDATVHGHNEFSSRPCPTFNAAVLL